MAEPESIGRLLRPRSIAIVGASPTPGALGASVLANLDRNGFGGEVHLINPKRDEIGGRPCLKAIDELPEGVDVAVLAIPRAAVIDSVRALAGRKVGGAVIFSAGFAEGGDEGLAEQREIARLSREAGMAVIGPNCLGMINFLDRIPLTFIETAIEGEQGGLSIISQSGAMMGVLGTMLASRKLGLSFGVSTGNEAVTGVEDYLEFVIEDPSTRVIAMIVEQFRSPRRFLAAAKAARSAGKTILLLHPGKSAAARASAATHTGALAGDYKVMRSLVARAGVAVAETLVELADAAEIALRCPTLPRGGVAVLGESGAFKALSLDLCEELDLALPTLDDANAPALRAAIPEFVPVSNPLDLTAQGLVDPDLYRRTISALLDDERVGAILLGIIQDGPATMALKAAPILQALREKASDKPVMFAGLDEGAVVPPGVVQDLRDLGVPCFASPERALRAVKRLSLLAAVPDEAPAPAPVALPGLDAAGPVIPEARAKALLGPAGIAFPPGRLAQTAAEAQAAAEALGYPVALKIQSVDLSHKSDVGGVVLNCADAGAVARGWDSLTAAVGRIRPAPAVEGVLVERMGKRGVELIVGGRNDPEWGAVVLVGFGGVQAEILQDVRILAPDLSEDAIVAELLRLKQAPLLTGFRGAPPMDLEAVAGIVRALSGVLLAEPRIREIDLNPVVVYPVGEGAVALDALIYAGPDAASP